jgi:hypothetical protein
VGVAGSAARACGERRGALHIDGAPWITDPHGDPIQSDRFVFPDAPVRAREGRRRATFVADRVSSAARDGGRSWRPRGWSRTERVPMRDLRELAGLGAVPKLSPNRGWNFVFLPPTLS